MEGNLTWRDQSLSHSRRGRFTMRRLAAGTQALDCEATWAIIAIGYVVEHANRLLVFSLGQKKLGGLFQSDDNDPQDGKHKHKGARGVPDVAPSLVVGTRAVGFIGTRVAGDECPGEEARNELPKAYRSPKALVAVSRVTEKKKLTPPRRQEGQQPLILAGQVFQKHSGVQDQVAPGAEGTQGNKQSQHSPRGRCPGNDGEDG